MDFKIIPIFPTTLLCSILGREIIGEEIKAIKNLDYINNKFNLISKNTNVLNLPELQNIRSFFKKSLDCYMKEIVGAPEVDIYITQSWVNVTTENQSHHKHCHVNSFLSGVFYVEVDSNVDKINFERDKNIFSLAVKPTELNSFNSHSCDIEVKNGDLIIFPSGLHHSVPIKKESNKRISISFNTFLKGSIGFKDDLNQIQL
jgi:uncharacterized protein (TIGR02466 family)